MLPGAGCAGEGPRVLAQGRTAAAHVLGRIDDGGTVGDAQRQQPGQPHRRLPPRVLRRGRRRGARRGGATRVRPEDDDPGHDRQERGGYDHRDERAAGAPRAARGRRLPQVAEHLRGRVAVRQKIRAVHPRRIRVGGRR
jgi:hypothetical protein